MTVFMVLNKDDKGDKEYGTITIKPINGEEKTYHLRNNSMFIMKSRCVLYEVKANNQKVFLIGMKIGGPRTNKY